MTPSTKSAILASYAGRWFFARSKCESMLSESWAGKICNSKQDLALALWREFGAPHFSFSNSPRSGGCLCRDERPYGRRDDLFSEVVAFAACGQELSPKGLVDYGAQLAAARGEAGWWDRSQWLSFANWNGRGPVPGTGRFRWRSQFRNLTLGGGARKKWSGEMLAASEDIGEQEDVLWSGAFQQGFINRLARDARLAGDDILGSYDDVWRARQGNSWKNARGKRSKAWDRA